MGTSERMKKTAIVAAAAIAPAVLAVAPESTAQPAVPPVPPPYLPGSVLPEPGSFSYPLNNIVAGSPATVDARGVRIGTNVDPAMSAIGLPQSQLGNSPEKPGTLTNSNARYGIAAGTAPAVAPNPGVVTGGGNMQGLLEDPSGKGPSNAPSPDSAAPSTPAPIPGVPAPTLETPNGQYISPSSGGSSSGG